MNSTTPIPSTARPEAAHSAPIATGSAAIAATSVAFQLPAPGLLLTLGGYFGLLFAVYKFKNSGCRPGS